MLFDTDTECIYCGWREEIVECSPEVVAVDEIISQTEDADTSIEAAAEDEKLETVAEQPKEPFATTNKEIDVELKNIISSFKEITENREFDIEDTTDDAKIDIEDTIPDEGNSFTEEDFNSGIRYLEGKRFNLFDIIEKHGSDNKIGIVKEIREVTETSLKNAVKILDNALDDFFDYEPKRYMKDEVLDYVPQIKQTHIPEPENDIEPLTIPSVKSNIHRALAYNMIIRRGPDRKAQIIDELMRSVHISLPQATEAVDDAIKEYRESMKSN